MRSACPTNFSLLDSNINAILCEDNKAWISCTVIPWLTNIIRSEITFVSRNTHTDGKGKLLEWPDRSCLLLYVSARIH